MSDGNSPESLKEIFKDHSLFRVNFSTYRRVQALDYASFIPLVASFGFLIYSVGVIFLSIIGALLLTVNAIRNGITWSLIGSAPTALLIGSVVIWYLIRQIADQIEFLTSDQSSTNDGESTALKYSIYTFLGMLFWIIGSLIRIHFVPGINSSSFYSSFPYDAGSAILFFLTAISVDVVYFGIILLGTGIVIEGVYGISKEIR